MRLITPKRARKSPKTLTNCASQSVRNGLYFKIVFTVKACGVGAEALMISASPEGRLSQAKGLCAARDTKKFTAAIDENQNANHRSRVAALHLKIWLRCVFKRALSIIGVFNCKQK